MDSDSEASFERSVCVIGAGAAGLTSIKAALEAGFRVTAYERSDQVGGLWDVGAGSATSATVTNSSTRMSCFTDFAAPSHWPTFLPRHLVFEYLNKYADHFHLRQHIQFQTMVLGIVRQGRRWAVTVSKSESSVTETCLFDSVMLCIGHHCDPHIPVVPGSHKFGGRILHSKYFDPKAHDLKSKTVVVIGCGNSAGDAAVEAGDDVILAMRSGVHVAKRTIVNGIPMDDLMLRRWTRIWLNCIAPLRCMRNGLSGMSNVMMNFDPKMYNFPPVHHGIMDRQPIMNDLLLPQLQTGRVRVLPIKQIDCFTNDSIVFLLPDGARQSIKCDIVVYATGYLMSNQLVRSVIGEEEFLFRKIFPSNSVGQGMTLGLIGHVQPLGPQFPLMEMQARYFIMMQEDRGKLPSHRQVRHSIRQDMRESQRKGRDAETITWMKYMETLADEMGIGVPMTRLFFTKHKLWRKLFFGSMTADQFRMFGRRNALSHVKLI